jgi:predicted outer membrane repeat protein
MATAKNTWILRMISATLAIAMLCSAAYAKVIYVDDDAGGSNDGTSWTNAYVHLQDALAEALGWERPLEIRVAQGHYQPDQGANRKPGDTSATFELLNNVSLRGGFAGGLEPNPNAQDARVYETILSGDLAGNDGPDFAHYEDNAQAVITSISNDQTALLEGFTVTGGFGWSGAGLNCYDSSPVIDSCTFKANIAVGMEAGHGGAASFLGGAPLLSRCMFTGNYAQNQGGAIRSEKGANLTIRACTFTANWANEGGGVYIDSGTSMTLAHCLLTGNQARYVGGALLARWDSSPRLSNCTLADNRAPQGPAISSGQTLLWNCIVWNQEPTKLPFHVLGDGPIAGYSCIQGGWPGPGTLDTDPLFVAPGYWDANDTLDDPNDDFFVDGDYHLQSQIGRWDPNSKSWAADEADSRCIDAGDPNSQVGDEPFPNGGIINMGAYGGTAQASKSATGDALCGTSTYAFVPELSTIIQTGGFAGVHWTYRLEGWFQLTVNCRTGVASFSYVQADATDASSAHVRTLDPDKTFNMTDLVGTVSPDGTMSFLGKTADESKVVMTLAFKGSSVRLVGETTPPPGSADFFLFSIDAVAQLSDDI